MAEHQNSPEEVMKLARMMSTKQANLADALADGADKAHYSNPDSNVFFYPEDEAFTPLERMLNLLTATMHGCYHHSRTGGNGHDVALDFVRMCTETTFSLAKEELAIAMTGVVKTVEESEVLAKEIAAKLGGAR